MRIFGKNGRHQTRMVGGRLVGNENGRWETGRHRIGLVG